MTGPKQTPPLSAARERVLRRVAAGDGPLTLVEVHGDDRRHPNATRQILGALTDDGLLVCSPVSGRGRGRPRLAWSMTAKGRAALDVGNEAATVVGVLASYLVESTTDEAERGATAHDLGTRWSEAHADLVDGVPPGVDGLVDVLDALGFDPVRRRDPAGESLLLRSCPLLGPARDNRELVCEMHRGMLDGVVSRIGSRQGVTLLPFAETDGCCVEVDDPDLGGPGAAATPPTSDTS